jgi:Nitrile hydratase, alpha chain
VIPPEVEIRVHDSNANMRYLVMPVRPDRTEGWIEDQLATILTRDCMIGVALPSATGPWPYHRSDSHGTATRRGSLVRGPRVLRPAKDGEFEERCQVAHYPRRSRARTAFTCAARSSAPPSASMYGATAASAAAS